MKYLRILLLSFSLFCQSLFAADIDFRSGICGAKFLKINMGARPIALGKSFVSVGNDINSIYWNPAGLSYINKKALSVSHNEWLYDTALESASYAFPSGQDMLGISCLYVHMGEMAGYDENGENPYTFNASGLELALSYAGAISPGIRFGSNIKMFQETLENERAEGYALDLGFIYGGIPDRFSAGICIRNLGPWIKFIDERESLPQSITAGAGYRLLDEHLTLSLDITQPCDNALYAGMGAELMLGELFSIRAGYTSYSSFEQYITGGFGLKVSGWLLDYSYVPYGTLDTAHHMTLSKYF